MLMREEVRHTIGFGKKHKIRTYRTMIGMAEDAYQLKRLDDIMDYDSDLQIGKNPVYNTEQGVIYKEGKIYTTDYSEDESKIIVRDYVLEN